MPVNMDKWTKCTTCTCFALLVVVHTCCLCVEVPFGEDASFPCPTISDAFSIDITTPVLQFQHTIWINGNHLNVDNYILWQNLTAVAVRNVTVRHEGEYICTATTPDSFFVSVTSIITVYNIPSMTTLKAFRQGEEISVVKEGDVLDIECSVKGVYPEVTMFQLLFGNSVLPDQPSSSSSSTVNNDGTFHQTAVFSVEFLRDYSSNGNRKMKCRAILPRGNMAFTESPAFDIIVQFKPVSNTLTSTPRQFVIEGDTQTVTCQTDALNPDTGAGMRWFRTTPSQPTIELSDSMTSTSINTVVQPMEAIVGFTVTSTLSFTADKSHNQASHRCVPVWRGDDVTPIRDHALTVYFPAHVVIISGCGDTVNEDGNCTLFCAASGGNPQDYSNFEWRFRRKFSDDFQVLTGQTSPELILQSVDYSDAGTYECAVTNSGGLSSGSADLDIKDAPSFNAESFRWANVGDFIALSWETPTGFFTRLTLQQCLENSGHCLEPHDVTNVNALIISASNGTELEMIVWQNQDPVLRHQFSLNDEDEKSDSTENGPLIGAVVAGSIVFVVGCTVAGLLFYRKRQRNRKNSMYVVPDKTSQSDQMTTTYMELDSRNLRVFEESPYQEVTSASSRFDQPLYLEPVKPIVENVAISDLHIQGHLRSGSFATIGHGTFRGQACVVKRPVNSSGIVWLNAQTHALRSINQHKNVMVLLAYNSSTSPDTCCLVTSYEANGDLKSFLTRHRALYMNTSNVDATVSQELNFAQQIVRGAAFLDGLTEMGLLHYNLSASNILLSGDLNCTLTGFMSARDVKERQRQALALKDLSIVPWLAPECIISVDEHTSASDVWSYGVLLYELSTYGQDPYADIELADVGSYVLEGNTLTMPGNNEPLYDVARRCWKFDARDRPSWKNLLDSLDNCIAQRQATSAEYEIL